MGNAGKVWVAGAMLAVAGIAVAGCDPADGLGSAAVSTTTDQLATHLLKQDNVKVQWLSCSASTARKEASVDCVGRTDDQQRITVKGEVTEQMDDACVRGHLTAVVGRRTVWDVRGLGNCGKRTPTGS